MILTNKEIKKCLEEGSIVLTPFNEDQLGPNSYDVTLNKKLLLLIDPVLDVKKPPNYIEFEIPEEGAVLQPGNIYIGSINEYTETHNLVPIMHGKSSLGRLGLMAHICAGLGDISFKGKWTVELTCFKPIRIYPNMQIAQIVYHEIVGEPEEYKGKYQNSIQAEVSKFYKNYDNG